MARLSTTSLEFLQSEGGREFTRSMVELFVQTEENTPVAAGETPDEHYRDLATQFIEHLGWELGGTKLVPPSFRPHLDEVYRDRFIGLYPEDPDAERKYLVTLTKIVPWLARLTANVWRLDTGKLTGHPKPTPGRELTLYHLHWARECFGWWRAKVESLPYGFDLPRPCKPDPTTQAMLDSLDDALKARLATQSRKPVEVEDGCPVC